MNQEERIDQYIRSKLDENEKSAFEQELQEDKSLAQATKRQKELTEGIKDIFRADMLRHFGELEASIAQEQPKTGNIRRLVVGGLAIAASLLLIVWVWVGQNQASPDALFAEYHTTYPNYVANVERNEPVLGEATLADIYKQSFQQYEQGLYAEATKGFEQVLQTKKDDKAVYFYLGLSYLELDEAAKALQALDQAKQGKNTRYTLPARWYSALAKLKLGQLDAAKTDLENLAKEENAYQAKAQDLLNDL